MAAGAGGVLGWLAARHLNAPVSSHILIGWDAGALVYVVTTWRLFLTADEAEVRRRAAAEDEKPPGILLLVLAAILSSLVAVVVAMLNARSAGPDIKTITAACAGVTLVLSWVVLHSVFTLHYAHRHFGDGTDKPGFLFPGEPASTYLDFVYLAFSIGATFQVSDNNVLTAKLRNLVTAQAVCAYFYNTAVLALGINIIASLVGN
ncbi:DUF1345 domain-containing protein [Caulobacter sp. BE254]|uniref:DUF1345 domain-containing protein n=1 Tax=Caulobacter sp. BE254 TaxID=2817720 RepID=UPI00286D232E|nr:DUF1345 domain-containing protein [Caulobacter sp. BE254]